MPNLKDLNLSSKQATICIIGALELIFLILLVYAFQFSNSADLKAILKDVFLGWNTALALALNTTNSSKSSSNPSITQSIPTPPPLPIAATQVRTSVETPIVQPTAVNTVSTILPQIYK